MIRQITNILNDVNRQGHSVIRLMGRFNDTFIFKDLFHVLETAFEV